MADLSVNTYTKVLIISMKTEKVSSTTDQFLNISSLEGQYETLPQRVPGAMVHKAENSEPENSNKSIIYLR